METTAEHPKNYEFTNYLLITGEADEIKKLKLVLQYDPQNIVGDDSGSMDNKILSFERLVPTPLSLLSTNPSADSAGDLAEERRTLWGTSKDAYCVTEHDCDEVTLMFEFRTQETPATKVLEGIGWKFCLKYNLTYFSQDGKRAGVEIFEQDEHAESLRFEDEGYNVVLMKFLSNGINPYDTSSDLFIEYREEVGGGYFVGYLGTGAIEIW